MPIVTGDDIEKAVKDAIKQVEKTAFITEQEIKRYVDKMRKILPKDVLVGEEDKK